MKKSLLLLAFSALMIAPSSQSFAASNSNDIKEAASQVSNEPAVGTAQDAMKEFKSLSNKEQKERFKEAKKEIKNLYKKAPTAQSRKYLRLTLIFLAAAIGLGIIAAFVPFVGILSGLAGLGAVIFFVLWLVAAAGTV